MSIYQAETLRALLSASNASLTNGLGGDEIEDVEGRLGFHFGPDQRELLTLALPIGKGWLDWRNGSEDELRSRLAWPVDSLLFHAEREEFWPPSWGERPADQAAAVDVAGRNLRRLPKLVPVYGHRFLPAAPCEPRSPVFSVYGPDTVYYGCDLEDYLRREFVDGPGRPFGRSTRHVPFWSELAENRPADL